MKTSKITRAYYNFDKVFGANGRGTIYQGSYPPIGTIISDIGFDAVVLCAEEYQPESHLFNNIKVFYVPLKDNCDVFTDRKLDAILDAASCVSNIVRRRGNVLVTCAMGLNRSGLISALSIHFLTGMSGRDAARIVASNRKSALNNKCFVDFLCRIRTIA